MGLLAEAAVGLAVGEAALSLAAKVGVGLASEVVEAGAGVVAKKVIPQVAGQDLEPGGIHPQLIHAELWQTLAPLYRSATTVQQAGWHLPLLLGNTEYALGQWRLLVAGAQADMSASEVFHMAADLVAANHQMRALDAEIGQRTQLLQAAMARLNSAITYPPGELEQDIWIVWMAGLPISQSDVLDQDAIEDHLHAIGVLGSSSRLGVNFGRWTSEDDELEAISAALTASAQIRERFNKITSGG